ncbi:nicotinamide riboside kinase 1 [Athalia rosae]|uniref:nicotinamide riboside kinase 1 n=1 Tax=Athalia rosae TaxID=37344 RepID=UPI0020348CA1|nr:nicotinamide riboside kinase 1 [Athalia rosae]
MSDWLVVGLAGVTCSGKTSLSNKIHAKLSDSVIVNQDDYFLPVDSPRHTFIPELNHINFDILSSLDMQKMHRDVLNILRNRKSENGCNGSSGTKKVLIIEGFLIYGYKPISDLCDLKYFITLDQEVCWDRRKIRTYEPPDVPGYFDKIVWPEYLKHKSEILDNKYSDHGIKLIDGLRSKEDIFEQVYTEIKTLLGHNHRLGDLSVVS